MPIQSPPFHDRKDCSLQSPAPWGYMRDTFRVRCPAPYHVALHCLWCFTIKMLLSVMWELIWGYFDGHILRFSNSITGFVLPYLCSCAISYCLARKHLLALTTSNLNVFSGFIIISCYQTFLSQERLCVVTWQIFNPSRPSDTYMRQ